MLSAMLNHTLGGSLVGPNLFYKLSHCAIYIGAVKFDYPWEQHPEWIATKLGVNNYAGDFTSLSSKYGSNRST